MSEENDVKMRLLAVVLCPAPFFQQHDVESSNKATKRYRNVQEKIPNFVNSSRRSKTKENNTKKFHSHLEKFFMLEMKLTTREKSYSGEIIVFGTFLFVLYRVG